MKNLFLFFIPFLSLTYSESISFCQQTGDKISGKVMSVIDGDTYDLLIVGGGIIRIRMEGIDAPERGMPFFNASKQYLEQLCYNKEVTVHIFSKDEYGRFLAKTYLGDRDELGQEMIKAGLAWHFKRYNSEAILANLETIARTEKKGLWIDSRPMSPWMNRSYHWQGISTKDSFNILEHQK